MTTRERRLEALENRIAAPDSVVGLFGRFLTGSDEDAALAAEALASLGVKTYPDDRGLL